MATIRAFDLLASLAICLPVSKLGLRLPSEALGTLLDAFANVARELLVSFDWIEQLPILLEKINEMLASSLLSASAGCAKRKQSAASC